MRKYILLLMTLCLHMAARGQTGYQYEYWFDNDRSTLQSGSSESGAWQMQADVSGLSESFHAIHLQVRDQEGNLSSPVTRYFVKAAFTQAASGRYWFDDAIDQTKTSPQVEGVFDIDVSHLSEGFHSLHYQMVSSNGNPSSMVNRYFYKANMPAKNSWRCWFDNDQTTQTTGSDMGSTILLDVTALQDGYHLLHILADGGADAVSTTRTIPFIKIPQVLGVDHLTCLCMVDDQLHKMEDVSAQGGVIEWELDVSTLPQGFHRMFVQVITPSGAATSAYQAFFLRSTTRTEFAQMKCVYAIDGSEFNQEAGVLTDGTFHFDLNVADLEDGLHTIAYMLSNGYGTSTKTQIQFFTKIPLGGYGINQYEYWLNTNYDTRTTQKVEPRQDPFSLISLLPVETLPIRSSNFKFTVKNNAPLIYAKNEFHIRFYDASGRFTETVKEYVDEKVSQQVEPVGELQETLTFDRVAENGIRWYTINLEEGDSVAFKSSQACTMQLFAPSGEEVYAASGSESVAFDGCHAWEDGTYYLAVHDVMGSQSRMALEYMHMDKYDVVDQDVWAVGNGGCSTITFSGNGFRDLGSVELYNSLGDKIYSLDVGHESDASTSVTFDFTGVELGEYSAVFHFSEEDKDFSNILTVEEPVDIELATTVTYPSVFLRGTSTTYTIKIENKGNMTAYRVPIDIQISTDSKDGITKAKFSNNVPALNIDWTDNISVSEEDIESVKAFIAEKGDLLHFITTYDSINNKFVKVCLLAVDIAPSSTYTITLNLVSNEEVQLYSRIPSIWNSYSTSNVPIDMTFARRRAKAKDTMCCYREKVECVMNVIVSAADFASFFVGPEGKLAVCLADLGNTMLQFSYDVWCGEDHGGKDMRKAAEDLAWDAVNGLIGCATNIPALKKLGNLDWVYQHIYNNISTTWDCVSALSQKIPNCPPNPGGGGGSSTPVNSLDPNDIYGYTSESGSKYISKDVQKVNYTIEFENDPEFATASAHTVVVKDVLDKNLFDLASYKPTAIKIGDKIVDLNGDQTFVTTVDMRPAIDAIAQVDGMLDSKTGTVTWSFTSLDPMSMEPSYHVMQGFLPVNADGNGIGEVMFDINLKQQFPDGTEIPNQASIVFDTNEAILTPVWTNTIDAVAPTSHVSACEIKNDTTATLHFESEDNLSGVWKYDVYVQYEENASWTKVAEGVTEPECDVRIYEGINHGFYVVATDSAGNVEMKEAAREYTLDLFEPTEDSDLELELAEGWNWISHNLNTSVDVADVQTHATRILGQEEETIKDATFGFVGDLTELKPTLGYKILMDADDNVTLDGKLYNASYKSIGLSEGWNWIGYPLAHEMEIAQALENFTPEEGDYIIGQDDFTQYADGEWVGTLSTLTPGLGYLYKSGATKQMFFNSTATLSSRAEAQRRVAAIESPWSCDKHKYPNVMAVTACLYNNEMAEDAGDYYVAAFCDNECRGVGKTVKGLVMMNVYGQGNETIQFKVIDKETEQLMDIAENVAFNADVQGSIAAPFRMTIGDGLTTDIANRSDLQIKITPAVIRNTMTVEIGAERIDRLTVTSMNGAVVANWKKLANGSTVDVSSLTAGVYVVTVKAGKQVFTKKVMKVTE